MVVAVTMAQCSCRAIAPAGSRADTRARGLKELTSLANRSDFALGEGALASGAGWSLLFTLGAVITRRD